MRYTSRRVSHRSEEFQQLSGLIAEEFREDLLQNLRYRMGLPSNYVRQVRIVETMSQPKTVVGFIIPDRHDTNLHHAYSIVTNQMGYNKTRDSSLKWVKDQAKQTALNA